MQALTQTDQEAVKQAVLDYVEGVYKTDPAKIERSVHPELAKRGFFVDKQGATESTMSFTEFIEHVKNMRRSAKRTRLFNIILTKVS